MVSRDQLTHNIDICYEWSFNLHNELKTYHMHTAYPHFISDNVDHLKNDMVSWFGLSGDMSEYVLTRRDKKTIASYEDLIFSFKHEPFFIMHTLPLEKIPPDIWYYILANWCGFGLLFKIKGINRYFNNLVKYVIQKNKYNPIFLQSQKLLLNNDIRFVNSVKENTEGKIDSIQAERALLLNRLRKLEKTKKKYEKKGIRLMILSQLFAKNMNGKPSTWIFSKKGFSGMLHGQGLGQRLGQINTVGLSILHGSETLKKVNIDYFLKKNPTKTWIWFHKHNNEEKELLARDSQFKSLGWIKYFPTYPEKDIAFLFVHPAEPICTRKKFHNCPICKSSVHSMFDCKNAWCFICKKDGHLTRTCPRAKCGNCGDSGHTVKGCLFLE